MEKTINIIKANIKKNPHFGEYFKITTIIKENELINPDICIESCKALIEGISKTIIVSLDNTKTVDNIDIDNIPKLFSDAMKLLANNCQDIEGDFVLRFSGIINVLAEIRNKRGDISHGRMAPKAIYSSKKLASTVMNMTDTMLEYTLEHYFDLDLNFKEKIDYNADEMKSYNNWLDESVDFPIAKARYSQILYEHDLDEYEGRYFDEYLKSLEENEIAVDEIVAEEKPVEKAKEEPKKEIATENKREISLSEQIIKAQQEILQLTEEESKIFYEATLGKNEDLKPVVQLINTFDEKAFWTENRIQELNKFADTYSFYVEGLKKVIENYIAFNDEPRRDVIAPIMRRPPSLADRRTVLLVMLEEVLNFANDLKDK